MIKPYELIAHLKLPCYPAWPRHGRRSPSTMASLQCGAGRRAHLVQLFGIWTWRFPHKKWELGTIKLWEVSYQESLGFGVHTLGKGTRSTNNLDLCHQKNKVLPTHVTCIELVKSEGLWEAPNLQPHQDASYPNMGVVVNVTFNHDVEITLGWKNTKMIVFWAHWEKWLYGHFLETHQSQVAS